MRSASRHANQAGVAAVSRQRILIITRNLPPLVGGMERLNWHMADELSQYAKVRVVGPKGSQT
jgi:phosphatidylinositol alpha-1,6-mannosyltransferase